MSAFESTFANLFWLCAAGVFYTYVGYPALVFVLSRTFGRSPIPPCVDSRSPPTVSLLIAAFNEEEVIGDRLRNALSLDYPADRLDIVVASDGSTDGTAAVVREFASWGVRLIDFDERHGKTAVLNATVAELNSDILVLTDANTHFEPDAIAQLTRWFRDPRVGVVSGRLIVTDPRTGGNADGAYWKYETFLKDCEARLAALLGANGAIYALRRSLFRPLPDNTIVDDLVLPLLVKLNSGRAIIYDPTAVAHEESAPDVAAEFRRRARIGAGGFQSLGLLAGLLHPRYGWTAFAFFSHKLMRWLCPFLLLGLLTCNLALVANTLYRAALTAQVSFYLTAVLASSMAKRGRVWKPLRLASMFAGMNMALMIGFWRWLVGTQRATWQPTARYIELAGEAR